MGVGTGMKLKEPLLICSSYLRTYNQDIICPLQYDTKGSRHISISPSPTDWYAFSSIKLDFGELDLYSSSVWLARGGQPD